MDLEPPVHDWLRGEAFRQTGDDHFIPKVVARLVQAEMEREGQPTAHTRAD
jgi:hypothetical protein